MKVEPFLNPKVMSVLYERGHTLRKVWGVVSGFVRRIAVLFRVRNYDYIFIHREVTPLGPPVIEFLLLSLCRRVIYDFDDAIYLSKRSLANVLISFAKWPSKVRYVAQRSWKVSVSTPVLMSWAKRHNPNVALLPSTVDLSYHKPADKPPFDSRRPVIGWTGTHSTARYLDLIRTALRELQSRYDFEFRVICSVDPGFPELKNYRFIRWRLETEIEDLSAIDIGLMPLPDGEWERGKAGFKAIQYSAVEAVPVVSHVGAGASVVVDGQTGFVIDNATDSWTSAIGRLLADPALLAEMGRRGRKFVEAKYSVSSQQDKFLSLFSEA